MTAKLLAERAQALAAVCRTLHCAEECGQASISVEELKAVIEGNGVRVLDFARPRHTISRETRERLWP